MHIIMANTVFATGGVKRTPVARHVTDGTTWQDTLSGDGKTILTIIEDNLPDDVADAINADPDVIDHLKINLPRGNGLPPNIATRVAAAAARHGFPMDALPEDPTVDDVVDAVVKRVRFSQVIAGDDLAEAARIKSVLRRQLVASGFDVSAIVDGDNEAAIRAKAMKHRNRP